MQIFVVVWKNLLNRVCHGTHPRDLEKVNISVAQNEKQRNLYYPNLERRDADASQLQASQHSTRWRATRSITRRSPLLQTARAFRRDERALDDDDDRGEIPRAAGITASFSGTTRPVLSLSLFSVGSEDLRILGLAHVKVKPRKCTTTKFPPSSSIMAALLTSTLPPPSAHWYPYCKQLLLERLLLVF